MSFLKKLFGDSNSSRTETKPDITSLFASNDTDKLIIELDTYLNKISNYGEILERLNEIQKTFYFNQQLEKEINNGGFDQYFFNSSGNFAHQTIISLRQINASNTSNILQLAINEFPDSIVPENQMERRNILKVIEEKAEKSWEELDKKFLAYEDNLTKLNLEFIQQNRNSF